MKDIEISSFLNAITFDTSYEITKADHRLVSQYNPIHVPVSSELIHPKLLESKSTIELITWDQIITNFSGDKIWLYYNHILSDILLTPRNSTMAIGAIINLIVSKSNIDEISFFIGSLNLFNFFAGIAQNKKNHVIGVGSKSNVKGKADVIKNFNSNDVHILHLFEDDILTRLNPVKSSLSKTKKKIGFLCVDGPGDYDFRKSCFHSVQEFMADECFVLVTDVNWGVMQKAFEHFTYEADLSFERIYHGNTPCPGHPTLWNGISLYKVKKDGQAVSQSQKKQIVIPKFGNEKQERVRFRKVYERMLNKGELIKLQFGPGSTPFPDFLNIDIFCSENLYETWFPIYKNAFDRFFLFSLHEPLPIKDNSVSFIFHQDMFEHLTQKEQILFLAETYRILKPQGIHRINAPDLRASMLENSDFSKGYSGVYIGEWDRWDHKSVPTFELIREMADIVGYSEIYRCKKGFTNSGFEFKEIRPGTDRGSRGNVIIELEK